MDFNDRLWVFKALDTFFFRDGSPYNAGESGQTGARSVFPPFMSTLQGAVRIVLAAKRGWTPERPEKWPAELGTPDDLGRVELRGPYLLKGGKFLFPMPLHILHKEDPAGGEGTYTRLQPGEAVECDLGRVRLPVPRNSLPGAKPLENAWLDEEGMSTVLNGGLPAEGQVHLSDELWREENRVGIERDRNKRTAADKKLYSCVHVRPQNDLGLAVLVGGVPEDWHPGDVRVVRLGGEGRPARVEVSRQMVKLPSPPELKPVDGVVRFTVTLITPGRYADTEKVIKHGPPGIPGECVSACIGKLQTAGGWDSENRCPRPAEPVIPAGSTWFLEAKESALEEIKSLHGKTAGAAWGYGQMVLGRWEE
ncbi:type III-B CRISPR module-associated protein Cmr3 [Desulfallas sp. Bu1-1]|jgi:CRISPR-associated protein Cmr3|uniref:type III-B CRISPR module-associated Cmr3 family protein n=1 Tax=Desulfallas sp. Bu1-1 TaxID=2787620 RepID=UPI00189E2292|nr:type III-B CRISPR module-associated Cmr3 family protein [Desulfallas sp. Bu1-1]MBF7084677.1 type III-B CRISPR module-associated protein Cmr3 [Desulfallas sp. Bu1-1]